jgi:hypothetical protein
MDPEATISAVSASSSMRRSSRPASVDVARLVTSAKAPETAIAWPAWPCVTCRSAAMAVSRLTGMNSEATSANAPSDSANTPPQEAGAAVRACIVLICMSVFLEGCRTPMVGQTFR